MSQYAVYKTAFSDPDALCAALADVGYGTVLRENGRVLIGYNGRPRKDANDNLMTADISVERRFVGGVSNDLGFKLVDGEYRAVISNYDRRKHNDSWLDKLRQRYARHRAVKCAQKAGYKVKSENVVNDVVQLTLEKW